MRRMRLAALATALLMLLCAAASAEGSRPAYLGSPLADFTAETIDGGVFSLSEALEDHDMVLINLWATWCGPCEREFPFLQTAYEAYRDRVAVVALSVESEDSMDVLRRYADARGLTFPMGRDEGSALAGYFNVYSIPTSVVVDRFGNVALVEAGAQSSSASFTALFDYFLDDGYTETVVLDGFPAARPAARPDPAALSAAGNAGDGALAFDNDASASVWPMRPVEIDGRAALASTNAGVDGSTAAVHIAVNAAAGDALGFSLRTSTEAGCDVLYVAVDGETVKRFSGERDWTSWAFELPEGAHDVAIGYRKDASARAGEDTVWIAGVRQASGEDAAAMLDALPDYPASDAFGILPANAGAREIAFDDPSGIVANAFGERGYILFDDALALRLTLPGDADPDDTVLYSGASGTLAPLAAMLNADGTGYEITLPLTDREAEGYAYAAASVYPDVADGTPAASLIAFADAESADGFMDYLAYYGYEVRWDYAAAPSAEASEAESVYTVTFVDQYGAPVPDCVVNFCTDEICTPVFAGEDGVATFVGAPDTYHLQVIRVPEGYDFDTSLELYTEADGGELTLVVEKR